MPRPPGTWERDGVLLKWGAVQRESRMGLRGVLLTRGGPCAAEASHAAGSRAAWGRGVLKGQAGIRACSGPWLRLWRGLGLGPPRHRQRWAAPDRAEARCPERPRDPGAELSKAEEAPRLLARSQPRVVQANRGEGRGASAASLE